MVVLVQGAVLAHPAGAKPNLRSAVQPRVDAPAPPVPPFAASGKPRALGRVVVDLSEQHIYLYWSSGALAYRIPVSTGGPGYRTPIGRFVVRSKSTRTFSRSNPAVKMDWMTRFNGGIGFHSIPYKLVAGTRRPLWTPLGDQPVSHGCVRTPDRWARFIFDRLPIGARVVVVR